MKIFKKLLICGWLYFRQNHPLAPPLKKSQMVILSPNRIKQNKNMLLACFGIYYPLFIELMNEV